ncbi:MAG: HEAT repeat domain-containing protein [Thermogutta sp.]|nr:HEAT repeat domain-containing protein [Thermogutta sp.]
MMRRRWRRPAAWATLGVMAIYAGTTVGCRPMPPMGEEGEKAAERRSGSRPAFREFRHTDKTPEEWLALLSHRKPQVRDQAIDALVQYGAGQVPALRKVVRETKSVDARVSAIRALSALGSAAQAAVPELVEACRAAEWDVRAAAAEALGMTGQGDPRATEALCAALRDEDAAVRAAAAKALRKCGAAGPDVVALLAAALEDPDANVQSAAADALGRLGAEARSALPALEKALQSAGPVARVSIEEALKNIRAASTP